MYLPKAFQQDDRASLCAFIASHPLATLVRLEDGMLQADHVPMLLERTEDGSEVLRAHVARANPLWRRLGAGGEALAVFQDPGLYVTPSWYPSKADGGKVVPTWNYLAVHVTGSARAVDDPAWLRAFLSRLTRVHESGRPQPWAIDDAPEPYVATMLKAIVGIEMTIATVAGKWKVSQNRQPRDIDGVIAGLRSEAGEAAQRMADHVERHRPH